MPAVEQVRSVIEPEHNAAVVPSAALRALFHKSYSPSSPDYLEAPPQSPLCESEPRVGDSPTRNPAATVPGSGKILFRQAHSPKDVFESWIVTETFKQRFSFQISHGGVMFLETFS